MIYPMKRVVTWKLALSASSLALVLFLPSFAFADMNDNFEGSIAVTDDSIVADGRAYAFGDVDGDGKTDLVTESGTTGVPAVFFDIDGTPTYAAQSGLSEETGGLYGMALGDLDGDGDLDLVTAGPSGGETSPNNVYYWDSESSTYVKVGSAYDIFTTAFYGDSVQIADVTGDGKPDVLWFGGTYSYLATNSTDTADSIRFSSLGNINGVGALKTVPFGSALGDFNGDGTTDFVAGDTWNYMPGRTFYLGIGAGDGTFTITNTTGEADQYIGGVVAATDFNGDGKDDFVLVRSYSRSVDGSFVTSGKLMKYVRDTENGGFVETTIANKDTTTYSQVVLSDIDGDSDKDIIAFSNRSGVPFFADIYLNAGNGAFAATPDATVALASDTKSIDVRDMNDDGKPDILAFEKDGLHYYTTAAPSDTTAPTVESFSPADDATDVAIATDPSITFDENVTLGTGNILIKRTADDSLAESMPVSNMTGSGTKTLTIHPFNTLPYNTFRNGVGYYIEIPDTAVEDEAGNAFAGITDSSTWNFTIVAAEEDPGDDTEDDEEEDDGDDDTSSRHSSHRSSGGSSVTTQVANLTSMGNTAAADALKAQWPQLFGSGAGSTGSTQPSTGIGMNVRDLELGMTGDDVLALQKLLNANGFPLAASGVGSAGSETDYFGSLTQAAVSAYQAANGVMPTAGYFGPLTRASMTAKGIAGLWW